MKSPKQSSGLVDLPGDMWPAQAIALQAGLQKFCSYNLQKFVCLCLILVILLINTVMSNTSLPKALFCLSFQNCH